MQSSYVGLYTEEANICIEISVGLSANSQQELPSAPCTSYHSHPSAVYNVISVRGGAAMFLVGMCRVLGTSLAGRVSWKV